ncbi:MAG: N-acetylmuramoyl-L-alanine amidase, partial [Clostridia bacterium]|nr:N-acetylmuramoyl-L-alanine amidase [Clostridia bacterium]
MKKTLSLLLVFCMIVSVMTSVTVSAESTYYDRASGITYALSSNGTASVTNYNDLGEYTETQIPHFNVSKQSNGSAVTGNTDNIDYTLGKGTAGETTVHASFLSKSNPNRRSSEGTRTPLAVVVHNTSMYNAGDNAMYLLSYQKETTRTVSWHYTVGMDCITQSLPENEMAYHAGDGGQGFYNKNSIGIETCVAGFPFPDSSDAATWKKGDQQKLIAWFESLEPELNRLAILVSEICIRYDLDPDKDVKQHCDASGKNCPMQFRYDIEKGIFTYEGTYWKIFKNKLRAYYDALTKTEGGTYIKITQKAASTASIPSSISVNGYNYTVTSIASKAFANKRENLTTVEIPATVKTIASDAFEGSIKLAYVNVNSKNRVYASKNGIVYRNSTVFFRPPVSPVNEFDESKLAAKIYVTQVNGSTTDANNSYVWADTRVKIDGLYWNKAIATYDSAMKAYKVVTVYKAGNGNGITMQSNQIAVVAHGTKISSAWNSVTVGSYLYLSGDIDIVNKVCSDNSFVGVYKGTTYPTKPYEQPPVAYGDDPFELTDLNSALIRDEDAISNISPKLNAGQLIDMFAKDVEIIDKNGSTVSRSAKLATGYFAKCKDSNCSGEMVFIIVNGDVDGNAAVDTTDLLMIKQHFKGTYTLDDVYLRAADVTGKGKLTVSDYILIKR